MKEIKIRLQKLSDAQRFYEILNNDNFKYFNVRPDSVEEEKEYLKKNVEWIKNNFQHNFTILYNNNVVGAIGLVIDQNRKFIGEIGYFLDENYWGKGITLDAVKQIENYCFNKLGLKRLVIIMSIENKSSERIAIKAGYKKEGVLKKVLEIKKNYHDAYLYAKLK